jgi:hypothetical protein
VWTGLTEYVSPITTSSTPSSLAIRAISARSSGSFIGSANCTRRSPLRTTERNTARRTSSPAGRHEMKRLPVVIMPSGVFGIAAAAIRMRSHGSSWW